MYSIMLLLKEVFVDNKEIVNNCNLEQSRNNSMNRKYEENVNTNKQRFLMLAFFEYAITTFCTANTYEQGV